jgi:hypothetical protein
VAFAGRGSSTPTPSLYNRHAVGLKIPAGYASEQRACCIDPDRLVEL